MGFSLINHPFGGTSIVGNPHMEVSVGTKKKMDGFWNRDFLPFSNEDDDWGRPYDETETSNVGMGEVTLW